MCGVLLTVGYVVTGVVAMAATQHRAAAAADLSALAGAGAHQQGHPAREAAPSGAAGDAARHARRAAPRAGHAGGGAAPRAAVAKDARLVSCDDDAGVVRVEVAAESVVLLG